MVLIDLFGRCLTRLRAVVRAGPWVFVFALVFAGDGSAFDQQPAAKWVRGMRIGMAAHDVDGLWSGDSKEDGPDLCVEIIFSRTVFQFLAATAYPNAGVSINTRGNTSSLYGGFLLQWSGAAPLIFSTGLGLAVHNGATETDSADQKSLGSRLLFRIPIEAGYIIAPHHRITLAFAHVSNAYLATPNEGMDTLGIFYGYQF